MKFGKFVVPIEIAFGFMLIPLDNISVAITKVDKNPNTKAICIAAKSLSVKIALYIFTYVSLIPKKVINTNTKLIRKLNTIFQFL